MSSDTLNDVITNDPINTALDPSTGARTDLVGAEYDYIRSFFNKIMKDENAAGNFADALYEVATITQNNVLDLFEPLKGQSEMELNESMSYYLNSIGSPAVLLGVKNIVKPNYYAARNVLS
jgi:hypothetical protein